MAAGKKPVTIKELFSALDTNGDGVLSFEEAKVRSRSATPSAAPRSGHQGQTRAAVSAATTRQRRTMGQSPMAARDATRCGAGSLGGAALVPTLCVQHDQAASFRCRCRPPVGYGGLED